MIQPPAPGALAGRYLPGAAIGRGAFGEVFEATDVWTGSTVAIKRLRPRGAADEARGQREIAALRMFDFPGVVRLLDSGTEDETTWIVMERVFGAPFPGADTPMPWEAVVPRAAALARTLERVHAVGVTHRDLKPSNVLVRPDGDVVVLDFGLAVGPHLGARVTQSGVQPGTPRYAAPEQLRGDPVGAPADVYAIGLLLYEALTGTLPFATNDGWVSPYRRIEEDTPPSERALRDLPPEVPALLDAMLARRPSTRPSAAAVAATLAGAQSAGEVPFLDGRGRVDALLRRVLAGESVDLAGPPGSGRRRLLSEVARRLEARGVRVAWSTPTDRPFASLEAPLGPATSDLPREADTRLREWLRSGVLLVPEPDRLDRLSRGLIERCRGAGAVLRVVDGATGPEPLGPDELAALFLGPDRFLHLAEDAAATLHARTGGAPGRVIAEVRGWVHAGLARWETGQPGRLRIGRPALDRLAAGLPIHSVAQGVSVDEDLRAPLAVVALGEGAATRASLATALELAPWEADVYVEELVRLDLVREDGDGLRSTTAVDLPASWDDARLRAVRRVLAAAAPAGHPARLGLHLAAGDGQAACLEAASLARGALEGGRLGAAAAALAGALALSRADRAPGTRTWDEVADDASAPDHPEEEPLLDLLVATALGQQTEAALRSAQDEVARTRSASPLLPLLEAARAVLRGETEGLTVPPMSAAAPVELRAAAEMLPLRALAAVDPEAAERALRDLPPDEALAPWRDGWLAQLRHRQARYAEAAALHHRAAQSHPTRPRRILARLGAAVAHLDDLDPEAALAAATSAGREAEAARLVFFEAEAAVVTRAATWRAGRAEIPDLGLVEALEEVGQPGLVAAAALTEAAVAMHAGLCEDAVRMATRARTCFEAVHRHGPAWLASCILAALAADDTAARHLAARLSEVREPRLALQGATLLARLTAFDPRRLEELRSTVQAGLRNEAWDSRFEVLDVRSVVHFGHR